MTSARDALSPLVAGLATAVGLFAQSFVDVTASSGLAGISAAGGFFGIGAGCADFDGDGDLDIVVPHATGQGLELFLNGGSMSFTSAGIIGPSTDPRAVGIADIDNDGDQDFLVANFRVGLQLFVNDGAANFSEQAQARGLTSVSSAFGVSFGDYDRDGWLDIYIANRDTVAAQYEPNILYRNLGNGYFADVTAATGAGSSGMTLAAAFCDFDEDGWPDIFCCSDKGYLYGPNTLMKNNGDGTFTDVADQFNAAQAIDAMGVDFVDAFNDGGVDLYVSDVPPEHLFLRWDEALGRYVQDASTFGLQGGGVGWAVNWLDVHNDGWQDVYVVHSQYPNALFENPGAAPSAQAAWTNGAAARGVAAFFPQLTTLIGDFDEDGGVDILNRFTSHHSYPTPFGCKLHRNNLQRGNWLRISPRGVTSNRDGLGAFVDVITGGHRQRQHVRSGVGYLSSGDRRVHFGVAGASVVDEVVITWPSGMVQRLEDVAVNQTLAVVEPSISLSAPAIAGGATSLELDVQGDEGAVYLMLLALGDDVGMELGDGRAIPVNLDPLLSFTLTPGNNILPNSIGFLSSAGEASSPLQLPALPSVQGVDLYAAAVTLSQPGVLDFHTVFPRALRFTIQ